MTLGAPYYVPRGGVGGGAPAWSPASLGLLRAWWRGNAYSAGTAVDNSGAGNDLATFGASPTSVANYNGTAYPSMRGDGSTQALQKAAFDWGAPVDQYTVWYIGTILSAPSDAVVWQYGSGANTPYCLTLSAAQAAAKMFGPSNITTSGIETGLQPQLVVCTWDGASQQIYNCTRPQGTATANVHAPLANSAPFTLFAYTGGLYANADIVEAGVMRKAITAAELKQLSYYARTKSNVATRVIVCADSIGFGPPYTGGAVSWRAGVAAACAAAGINVQMVGIVNGPDGYHRCFAGESTAMVVANTNDNLTATLTTDQRSRYPDVGLGSWGTNDALLNRGTDVSGTMLANAATIMDRMKAACPDTRWLWNSCTRPTDASFFDLWPSIDGFNAGLPALCASKGITYVPLPNTITFKPADVHPDSSGVALIAATNSPPIIAASRSGP